MTFDTPTKKRYHLSLAHFKDKLIREMKAISPKPACPKCEYKHKSPPDLFRHYGSVHKAVDKYLAEKVPSLVGPLKLSQGEATQCPICNDIVDLTSSILSQTLTPGSSRSNSPEPWSETGGSRPPEGEQTMETWSKGKVFCEFFGCDGYLEEQYYSHLAKHFKELLSQDIAKEKAMFGQKKELACPRCVFHADSISELHEHYGTYHQMLDYYVALSRDKRLLDKMVGGRIELEQGAGGE